MIILNIWSTVDNNIIRTYFIGLNIITVRKKNIRETVTKNKIEKQRKLKMIGVLKKLLFLHLPVMITNIL